MAQRKGPTIDLTGDEPARKVRRLKVMITKKLSNYNTNATSSPLLRLPPELRNRIWCLVLGGNSIHIAGWDRADIVHSICQDPDDDLETARIITNDNKQDGPAKFFENYATRHNECPLRPEHKRQPRKPGETALLPYQTNKFVCLYLEELAAFLQALVPEQARAIEVMAIQLAFPYSNVTCKKLVHRKLKGLRALTCFVELGGYWERGQNLSSLTISKKWTDTILQFEGLGLNSVTVLPYNSNQQWRFQKKELREWAEDLEGKLRGTKS
ncbi:hypothetical protein LTR56_021820 [Elasticomyces elasticus]|nr:hypothetical protein LTR56_021820 [Elasticomyces elasticus]KAK3650855.1 hypothetical protein LTR22_012331 [Elasticomyces elasticus]KAK4907004.1 hypothetical protein LTR49_023925 [Elasticomyces elasticus]KAK5742427.1 hypothetical protein LTS12_024243 [Elasticomyces elasticus]